MLFFPHIQGIYRRRRNNNVTIAALGIVMQLHEIRATRASPRSGPPFVDVDVFEILLIVTIEAEVHACKI